MHMRMVHFVARPDSVAALRKEYEDVILASLATVDGCLNAGLFHDVRQGDHCVSLTVWSDEARADAYARSPLFRELLHRTDPYLSESDEFTVRLSASLTIEEVHLPAEPEVSSYAVEATSMEPTTKVVIPPGMTIRTVRLSLRPGALEQFIKSYREGALPLLRSAPGCLHVFLSVPSGRADEVVSVTVWSDRAAVESYERSGLYARLLEAQEELLSPLYRWKVTHEKDTHGAAATSEDISVRQYELLVGRTFMR
jgi:quinol monooxygenase YgiN